MRAGGARGRGGGDSGQAAGAGERAMPHFTVVPVDGPRRGDYDNLEGLSWVDYGERAEREDADGEGAPGAGGGRDAGHARPPLAHTPEARAHTSVRAQLFVVGAAAATSLAPGAQTLFPGPWHPRPGRPPHPSSSLAGRGRGCRRGREGGQAPGAARIANSTEHPSLALRAGEHLRSPDPSPSTSANSPSLLSPRLPILRFGDSAPRLPLPSLLPQPCGAGKGGCACQRGAMGNCL